MYRALETGEKGASAAAEAMIYSPALKMTAPQIVGAMRCIAPVPRHRLGATIATAAIFMVSGCPSADERGRLS